MIHDFPSETLSIVVPAQRLQLIAKVSVCEKIGQGFDKANASTHHIFGEPGPAVGSNIDANADLVQGGAEQVDPVPAGNRLLSHA